MLTVEMVQKVLQNNMMEYEGYEVCKLASGEIRISLSVVWNNRLMRQNIWLTPEFCEVFHSPGTVIKTLVDKFRCAYKSKEQQSMDVRL